VPGARSTAAAPSADVLRKTDAMILRMALGSITLYALYWLYQAFTIHHIGNYGVETDFYWKYGPAAAALKRGHVQIEHFDSKGWGYPLVVAAVSFLGLDLFRAAQVVAVLSACGVLTGLFLLLRRPLGS